MRLVAAKFDQRPQARGFDDGFLQIKSGGRIEIQRVRFGIQKPFAGRVQFLEDIFHKLNALVDAAAAIVLPAALFGQIAVRILSGNAPGEIAPQRRVHRVQIASGRIRPPGGAPLDVRAGCEPVEVLRLGIKVRVTRQNLPLAVDENFLGLQIRRNLRLKNSVGVRLPVQIFEPDAAADDRLLALIILENHRRVFRAGIFRGEHERLGQIVSSAAQKNVAVFLAHRLLRALQRGERFFQRAGIRVVARRRNEIRLRAANARGKQRHAHRLK